MARRKKEEISNKEVLYKVTSNGTNAVFLNGKTVIFDSNKQAIVDKGTFEALKEMGVLV